MPLKNKILTFTEKFDYAPDSGGWLGLCKIDRLKSTCEPIMTDHPDAQRYSYDLLYKCREVFHKVFTQENKSILFTHPIDSSKKVSDLVHLVETKLNIPTKERSKFFRTTDYANVTAIRVSPFWLNNPIKRQLLSIFLRAGRKYSAGRTIQDCLSDEKNYKECWPAIELFLDGYYNFDQKIINVWKKDFHKGFVFSFLNKTKEEIVQQNLMTKN